MTGTSETSSPSVGETRWILTALGVIADVIAIFTLAATDAKIVVWLSATGAVLLSAWVIWRRWKEHRSQIPLVAMVVGIVGAVVGASLLAYDVGESRAASRERLESENTTLEEENEQLAAELEDAQEQLADEGGRSSSADDPDGDATTTIDPEAESTTSTRPPEGLQYLADMAVATSDDYQLEPGEWSVAGTEHSDSLGHDIGCAAGSPAGSDYNLNRMYQRFHASVGLSDNAGANETATFVLEVDGTPRFERSIGIGEVVEIDEAITGAFRISLRVSPGGCYENRDAFAVWGGAAVIR